MVTAIHVLPRYWFSCVIFIQILPDFFQLLHVSDFYSYFSGSCRGCYCLHLNRSVCRHLCSTCLYFVYFFFVDEFFAVVVVIDVAAIVVVFLVCKVSTVVSVVEILVVNAVFEIVLVTLIGFFAVVRELEAPSQQQNLSFSMFLIQFGDSTVLVWFHSWIRPGHGYFPNASRLFRGAVLFKADQLKYFANFH